MVKPLKITENNGPLSCTQHDNNIDALLDRRNHTNKIEDCEAAIDQDSLNTCVSNLSNIKIIGNELSDLKSKYELLNESIEPNGNIETAIQAIDARLNENVNSINSALISMAVDLELIDEGNTAVTSIYNLNQLNQKKNSVTDPRSLTRFTLRETKDNLNSFIEIHKPIIESNRNTLNTHLNPTNGTFTLLNNYINNNVKPVVNNQTNLQQQITSNKTNLDTTNSIIGALTRVENRTIRENLVHLLLENDAQEASLTTLRNEYEATKTLLGTPNNLQSTNATQDIKNNRNQIAAQGTTISKVNTLAESNRDKVTAVTSTVDTRLGYLTIERKPDTNLTIIVKGGPYKRLDGSRGFMPQKEVLVVSGKPNYIYLEEVGRAADVLVSDKIIETGILLGTVNASNGKIDLIYDAFHMPTAGFTRPYNAKKIGGRSSGDYVTTGSTDVISGLQLYKSFTVKGGHTLTVKGGAKIIVTDNFTVEGKIVVEAVTAGGSSLTEKVPAQSFVGNRMGRGVADRRSTYHWVTYPAGSGGRSGIAGSGQDMVAYVPNGGQGGGSLIVEAGGDININGIIEANGTAGQTGSITSRNVVGGVSGGGGGAGGCVVLKSGGEITISNSATIHCKGGKGGNAHSLGGYKVLGAGGGGGGWISLYANTINRGVGSDLDCSGGTEGKNGDGNNTVYSNGQGGAVGGAFGGLGGNGSSFTPSERSAGTGGIELIYERPNF